MKTIMCAVLLFAVPWRPVFAQDSVGELARILRDKGVITSSELTAVESSPGQERVRLLASLLEARIRSKRNRPVWFPQSTLRRL